jgi:hypothetical protein
VLDRPQQGPDPVAQFAAAMSLSVACRERAEADPKLNLSESYNGMDELMRVVMRIGELFERWACRHVNFDEMSDVWPYLLEDKFGRCCLEVMMPWAFAAFDESDCLRVALNLRLPVFVGKGLAVPLYLQVVNPVSGSAFTAFRIQTARRLVGDDAIESFVAGDDPFGENFDAPFFRLHGVDEANMPEHIADRSTYESILDLAVKLVPGIQLPKAPCYEV